MNEWLHNMYVYKGVQSIGVILLALLISRVIQAIARRRGKRVSEPVYLARYVGLFFFVAAMIFIWLEGIGPILTTLTIIAAALTIVAKELILNFLGSFVIFWRELFAIGDRVQVGEFTGDVINKGLLYFTLLEAGGSNRTGHSTGKLVKVPNAYVLTLPVVNATRGAGYVWNELSLTLARTSDWKKARQLLLDCAQAYLEKESINLDKVQDAFQHKNVFFKRLSPMVYTGVTDTGNRLTLRYLCKVRNVAESEDFICTRFLENLDPDTIRLYTP